ncbi:hypothetical protein TNCV_1393401 [Trichonephila clavipes]|nr:hypothetical protein TNCV_1393401 [Trichonephila clavipes]
MIGDKDLGMRSGAPVPQIQHLRSPLARKWRVIDPPFQLTLFDDNIQWVSVVKYLGLHIDSRLTFKKHIDYLEEKFWGRISLAIPSLGGGLLYP